MANLTTSEDIVNDVLFRNDEPTDGTSDFDAKVLEHVNRAYKAIWSNSGELDPEVHETWTWLRKSIPGSIILEPSITDGTVAVTNDSAIATLSAPPADSMNNWFFKVDGFADVFRVEAHTAASAALTLSSIYTGATDTTASYRLFKLEYDLASDLRRVVFPMRVFQDSKREITRTSERDFQMRWPLNLIESGVPDAFIEVGERKIMFNRYGRTTADEFIRVEYDYEIVPDDLTDSAASIPLVPFEYRFIISDWASYLLSVDKDDDRFIIHANSARSGLGAMAQDNRDNIITQSKNVGAILPRQGRLGRLSGPLRTASGLIIG